MSKIPMFPNKFAILASILGVWNFTKVVGDIGDANDLVIGAQGTYFESLDDAIQNHYPTNGTALIFSFNYSGVNDTEIARVQICFTMTGCFIRFKNTNSQWDAWRKITTEAIS
jgi:hypothetical protein